MKKVKNLKPPVVETTGGFVIRTDLSPGKYRISNKDMQFQMLNIYKRLIYQCFIEYRAFVYFYPNRGFVHYLSIMEFILPLSFDCYVKEYCLLLPLRVRLLPV